MIKVKGDSGFVQSGRDKSGEEWICFVDGNTTMTDGLDAECVRKRRRIKDDFTDFA